MFRIFRRFLYFDTSTVPHVQYSKGSSVCKSWEFGVKSSKCRCQVWNQSCYGIYGGKSCILHVHIMSKYVPCLATRVLMGPKIYRLSGVWHHILWWYHIKWAGVSTLDPPSHFHLPVRNILRKDHPGFTRSLWWFTPFVGGSWWTISRSKGSSPLVWWDSTLAMPGWEVQLVHCHSSLVRCLLLQKKDVTVKIHHPWARFASYSTVTLWIVALGDQRRQENFMELLDGRFKFNRRCGSLVGWWMRFTIVYHHDLCGFMSSTLKAVSTCLFAECPWVFVMRVLLLVLVLFKQASWEVLLLLYALKIKYPSAAPWRNNQLRTERCATSAHYSPSIVTWAQGVSESWQSWRPITKSVVTWHWPASFSNWFTVTDSWGTGIKSLVDASQYTEYNTVYICVPKIQNEAECWNIIEFIG